LLLQEYLQDHSQTGWNPQEVSDWITGDAYSNEGDRYGVNPLSGMAEENRSFGALQKPLD